MPANKPPDKSKTYIEQIASAQTTVNILDIPDGKTAWAMLA